MIKKDNEVRMFETDFSCSLLGGGEMGRKWYEEGKLLKKKNTFVFSCFFLFFQSKKKHEFTL